MIRKFAVLAIAVAAVSVLVSSAEAGGTSGAKKSSTIRVRSYSVAPDDAIVVLVPNGTAAPTTPAAAQSLGAKTVVAGGAPVSLPVAPGAGFLAAVFTADLPPLNTDPFVPGSVGTAGYNVSKAGLKGYMAVTGAAGAAPVVLTGAAAGGPF
jgi:hypothetical protein